MSAKLYSKPHARISELSETHSTLPLPAENLSYIEHLDQTVTQPNGTNNSASIQHAQNINPAQAFFDSNATLVSSQLRPHNKLVKTSARSVDFAATLMPGRLGNTSATILNVFAQPSQHLQLHVTMEHAMFLLLVCVGFLIRAANLAFNTLHLDEAIYATVGQQALAGVFDQGATRWMFGSYLYPALAATVNQFGGVVALRLLSAILSTLAGVFVYFTARRLFGKQAALWALFIFSLSGISINVGQHATYDVLGIALFAAALYCIVAAMQEREHFYLLLAGLLISLSILAKYIGVLVLPGLLMFALILYLYQGRSILGFISQVSWVYFILPVMLLLGLFALTHLSDLQQVLTGQYASQLDDRTSIIRTIFQDVGAVIVLVFIALPLLIRRAFDKFNHSQHSIRLLLLAVCFPLFLSAIFAIPLYHVVASNARSLWKHNVYFLVFLAPLAGYSLARLIEFVRAIRGRLSVLWRLLGAAATAVFMLLFVNTALAQNNIFRHSWPNNTDVIQYMQTQHITIKSRVLASSYAIYEYYFHLGVHAHSVWSNVWYEEYGGLTGVPAVKKAIQSCVYNVVVLDDYYAPELKGVFEPLLKQAGYVVGYQEESYGHLWTRVYTLPLNHSCGTAGAA